MKFTREQVIEMAREAGGGLESEHANLSALTRLCTLAADAALEAAAQKVAQMGHWTGGHGLPRTPRPEECAAAIRAMKEKA